MRRSFRILLAIVGVVLIVFFVFAVVIANYDWNREKPAVVARVSKVLNRSVAVDGDLAVHWGRDPALHGIRSWFPGPRVSASKVSVGNPDWSKAPTLASADSIEFDLSLLPLLAHTISIPAVRFVNPDVHLERLSEKKNNWTFAATDDDASNASAWKFDLGRVEFARGKVAVVDRVKQLDVRLEVDSLRESIPFAELVAKQESVSRKEAAERVGAAGEKSLAAAKPSADKPPADTQPAPNNDGKKKPEMQHYAFQWSASGTLRGKPVKGEGRTGGVLALKRTDNPFPLQADIRFGDTRVAFVGTLLDPTSPDALDVRLWLSGKSLAQLYDVIGVPLPESPPYATEGRLTGDLTPEKEKLRYEKFTARVGESDLDGELVYENKKPRPILTGTVDSKLLQFRDLAPLIGAHVNTDDGKVAPVSDRKILPEEQFRPERWKVMDADVRFTGDRVFRDSELPIHKLDTRVRMDNAVLSLDPLRFRFAYGDVDASMRMDGTSAPIRGQIKATAKEIQVKRLFKFADPKQLDLGNANATVELSGTGNSVGALLGAANGEVKGLLGSGKISKVLMEEAALNVPNIVIAKLTGDKQIEINCAAVDLVAKNGIYDSQFFLIDTDAAQITIDGNIDLANEKLDLTIHPDSKGIRLFSLRSPIHVKGTFAKPDIGIDKGVLLARGAGAIGLAVIAAPIAALLPLTQGHLSDDEDRCTPLLDSMRKAPAVAPPKDAPPASGSKRK
ncbi:MAG: AsmA family protein [Rudaea sp.]